jgi:hypothetical protein
VTYAPYWHIESGCVQELPNGMTKLTVGRPGIVLLHFAVTATSAIRAIEGGHANGCSPG